MEEVLDRGEVILDRIATLEVERAVIDAKIAAEMLEFVDLRRREAQSARNKMIGDLEISYAADELGLVLKQPARTVQCRLAAAGRVRDVLPRTWLAFGTGLIDGWRVALISSAADQLTDNYSLIHLDYNAADYASTHTGSQTKAWLKRFVATAEPDRAQARATDARGDRAVWVNHRDDGMSYLTAHLPTPEAVRIDHLLTAKAKALPADDRTFDNKRADLFADQFLGPADNTGTGSGSGAGAGTGSGVGAGTGSGVGAGSGRTAVLAVTVPVTSLAGVTNDPGVSFDGQFALPAGMVRDLAAEPGTLFHRILTDPLGRVLDVTEMGRFPSPALRTAVQARDGTCLFATCSRPAIECDLDHEIPHPRGPTNGANLGALCRRHHNFKTYRIADPRTATIHAPTPSRGEHHLATHTVTMHYAA